MPKAETYTLLIWEGIELQARLFLIPNSTMTHDERRTLRTAHSLLEGGGTAECPQSPEEIEALARVFCAVSIQQNDPIDAYPEQAEWRGKWIPYALPSDAEHDAPIENTMITHVYCCGVSL